MAAAGVALLALSPAGAQERGAEKAGDREGTQSTAAAARAAAAADARAPNARLAALVDSGGRLVRGKNVAGVSNPEPGVYCIRPANQFNLNTMIAVVSVEYFYSEFSEALVNWRSDQGFRCPNGRIEVYTLGDPNEDGDYVLTNGIAFTILVP